MTQGERAGRSPPERARAGPVHEEKLGRERDRILQDNFNRQAR